MALTNVSLTATPANEANSAEGSGIRVDGRDTLTQPIVNLKKNRGRIRWNWTPRHSAANLVAFGEGAPWDHVATFFFDATHFIKVAGFAANTIVLEINTGATTIGVWDCTGAIVAGTTYLMEIRYTPGGAKLLVDGAVVATMVKVIDFGASIPNTAYWGSRNDGAHQVDAVYSAP